MADKYVIQRRTASGLENVAELPALENGKVDLSWLPVVGSMGSAIIERGSNANGEYVRWADGTQVCWGSYIYNFNTTDIDQRITIIFPATFNSSPSGMACCKWAPGKVMVIFQFLSDISSVTLGFYAPTGAPTSTSDVPITWFAIGRWK